MIFLRLRTAHTFWTTVIRQIPKYTNETGLLAMVLPEKVVRISYLGGLVNRPGEMMLGQVKKAP
jgi:hypothetical protein